MATWTSYTVIAADGTTREFYALERAIAYARRVGGTVNGEAV